MFVFIFKSFFEKGMIYCQVYTGKVKLKFKTMPGKLLHGL